MHQFQVGDHHVSEFYANMMIYLPKMMGLRFTSPHLVDRVCSHLSRKTIYSSSFYTRQSSYTNSGKTVDTVQLKSGVFSGSIPEGCENNNTAKIDVFLVTLKAE